MLKDVSAHIVKSMESGEKYVVEVQFKDHRGRAGTAQLDAETLLDAQEVQKIRKLLLDLRSIPGAVPEGGKSVDELREKLHKYVVLIRDWLQRVKALPADPKPEFRSGLGHNDDSKEGGEKSCGNG